MIRAIIFDCFGVIITDALQVMCDELRVYNPAGAEEIKRVITLNNRGLMHPDESSRLIACVLGLSVIAYRNAIEQGEAKDTRLLAYILELRRTYKTAMLSNIGAVSLGNRFEPGELDTHFDVVVASGDIGYAKPQPEAYEKVAELLGIDPEECVFTDDRLEYCLGANNVGMKTILYEDLAQFKLKLPSLL